MTRCLEKSTRVDEKRPGAVVIDDIKRRIRGCDVAMIGLTCPACPSGMPGIFLRDRAAHQRSAGDRPLDRDEVGAETDGFMMLRAAAVFAYGIIHTDRVAVGGC